MKMNNATPASSVAEHCGPEKKLPSKVRVKNIICIKWTNVKGFESHFEEKCNFLHHFSEPSPLFWFNFIEKYKTQLHLTHQCCSDWCGAMALG